MPCVPPFTRRTPRTLLIAATLLAVACSTVRADPKRIYIANDDHTDYFWSGDDVQYRAAFLAMLDYYMTQAETTAARPSDLRGRFNCDGSLWVWEYEHNKTPAEFQRLIGHLRDSTITMPLNTAVICYGGMPAEAVLRSMYYAGRLERRNDLRFPLVLAMEDQTLPGGIASLWAGAGAQYSWRGVCGCATKTPYGNRPREIYRFLGPDSSGVILKWNTKPGPDYALGSYAEAWHPTQVVGYIDSDPQFLSRWPWPVAGAFGYGQDNLQTTTDSLLRAAQTLSNPNRRVIVSNEVDFFQDFLAQYGAQIPTFSGSFGNEWELYAASMGAVTGAFKREIEKLRTAEALATFASLRDPSFMTGREAARDWAFMAAGLYYEHDWTADGPITRTRRAQYQRDMLAALQAYVDPLYTDGLAALGAAVPEPAGSERHAVFNPMSWPRTEAVDLVVAQPAPFHVVDVATGAEVPSQSFGAVTGGTRVRILAQDVPSVGYRVYEVRAGAGASFPAAATVVGSAVDNGIYKVTLGSRGQITSVLDHKNADRELVDATGGGAIHDLGIGNGNATVESSGPVSVTLKLAANGTPKHETRVTLYAGLDRIDIDGAVTQNFSSNLAYRSRFALPGSIMHHEEVGMIARVARAADGGDYADANTRTDYLTFNHFVDLSQAAYGVTVSNAHSPFFQAGNSTVDVLDTTTPSIAAVVGMQVDGPDLGIPNQGGDALFPDSFALRTHGAYDPAAAMRFALEHQNPLVATPLAGTGGTLPAASWSLLTLPDPDVLLWALKPAEDGIANGVVARVWNLADAPRTLTLSLPSLGIASAMRTTHLETDLEPAAVATSVLDDVLRRQQIATYRIVPASAAPPQASIATPAPGASAAVGDSVAVTPGPDPRDPAGLQYLWEADRVHDGITTPNAFTATAANAVLVPAASADSAAQRYEIRLIVSDAAGAVDTATVSLAVRESRPPAFVAGPTATVVGTEAAIAWTTDEPTTGVIRHGATIALEDSLLAAVSDTAHADTLRGLEQGARHYFQVAATDGAGNTTWSPVDSFTTAPNTPPEADIVSPTPPAFFAFGDTLRMDGSATDAADSSRVLRLRWEVELLRLGQPPALVFTDSTSATEYVIPMLEDSVGIAYHVKLIATDLGGLADTATTTVLPDVDLSASGLIVTQQGPGLDWWLWARNLGRMPAQATRWMLLVDGAASHEGDVAVAGDDSVLIHGSFAPGELAEGSHVLRVVVDTLAQVVETDETNNAFEETLTLPQGGPTGVPGGIPAELRLSPAYPNPNPGSVGLALDLPRPALVRWSVFDLQGRVIWGERRERPAGSWTLRWEGLDSGGRRVPRGVYVMRLDVDGRRFTRRIVLQ